VEQDDWAVCSMFGSLEDVADVVVDDMCCVPLLSAGRFFFFCLFQGDLSPLALRMQSGYIVKGAEAGITGCFAAEFLFDH